MAPPLVGPERRDSPTDAIARELVKLLHDDPVAVVWRNQELRDPADDRRTALPLLALASSGLWVIQVHAASGELEEAGDIWMWRRDGQDEHYEPSPVPAAHELAARLRQRLQAEGLSGLELRPLVVLTPSAGEVRFLVPRRQPPADLAALTDLPVGGLHPLGALLRPAEALRSPVLPALAARARAALAAIGLHNAPRSELAGGWILGALLAEAPSWQEHDAVFAADPSRRARIRTWVLPAAASPERADALRRAATREAEVLGRMGQHPNILTLLGTIETTPPRLVFEPFDGGMPLFAFMRNARKLSFEHRLSILEQVALALDHIHRDEITHRGLCPEAVLVRWRGGAPEVRLHHFEGAVARESDATELGTRHLTYFSERIQHLYRAPEVFRDPDAADAQSDLFSLGALAWFIFVGRHPATSLNERNEKLREGDGLHLWGERDDMEEALDGLVARATHPAPEQRPASVRAWIREVTAIYREVVEPDAAPADPLRAVRGDALGPDLIVEGVLGAGASARVLHVRYAGEPRALKVPHDEAAERLVEAEHAVLSRRSHPNVVRVDDLLTLSGRRCLLMQLAGTETLDEVVRRTGPITLDYAARLGDELLAALEYLHGEGVTHRDIKPANLAFASLSNSALQLVLFDFSMAALPADRVSAGTPRWRDPWLTDRGLWDVAADLYAAAAVLHFALTGERPAYSEREHAVQISEARLDPDLRGALTGFFRAAFSADLAARPADAPAMRHAWREIFARDVTSAPAEPDAEVDARLLRARLDTPIGALGLSSRALNALERAGVGDVRDLLGLPRNRLSLVRGVGQETRKEIAAAIGALEPRLRGREDAALPAFLVNACPPLVPLDQVELGLPDAAVEALRDAGLRSARDLAEASVSRVQRLLQPHGVDLDRLRRALRRSVPDTAIRGPLGDQIAGLLRPHSKPSERTEWEARLGQLLGLDPLPGDAPDQAPPGGRTTADVVSARAESPVKFRSAFALARKHWDRSAALRDAAISGIGAALDRVGPVAPVPEVAAALLEAQAPELAADPSALTQAIALVRFGTEVHLPDAPFCWRLLGRHAWLARAPGDLDALAALARAADRLAQDPSPTPLEAAAAALRAHARPPLDALPAEALVQRAAQASASAALSPRLELYPRGLPAARALDLAAAMLGSELSTAQIRARISARYPDAEPLPDRPALDPLLERIGLCWSTDRGAWLRPGAAGLTLSAMDGPATAPSTTSAEPPGARVDHFLLSLRHSVESGRFRAIQVSAGQTGRAITALRRSIPGLLVSSLDAELWAGIKARVVEEEADLEFLLSVDRAGPEGPHWSALVELFVAPVVRAVIDRWLSPEGRARPRLVTWPGLLARYQQRAALDRLVQTVDAEDGAAVWLLVPSWDDGQSPTVRHPAGDLSVPVFLPGQRIRAPRTWISHVLGDS